MACVEIYFEMPDGEKRKDIFCHFDDCTELTAKLYWIRTKPHFRDVKITQIIVTNAVADDEPLT
jgi:hypothetical protein